MNSKNPLPIPCTAEDQPRPDSRKIILRENHLGTAVFASEEISAGEFIAGFYGQVYHAPKASQLPPAVRNHAIQFAANAWRDAIPGGLARNINHSCHPNCGLAGHFAIISLRPIQAGEELFFDYAMTENCDWVVPGNQCLCGTENCRGTILPFRKLPAEVKNRYQNHVSDWLKK